MHTHKSKMASDKVSELVRELVRELSEWKGLVANENSMEHVVELLTDSTTFNSKEIVQILGALVTNAQKYADAKWCGRILRPFVHLLSHDDELNDFVVECFRSATGRILNISKSDFVKSMVEWVRIKPALKDQLRHELTANSNRFPCEVEFFDLNDAFFDVWQAKLERVSDPHEVESKEEPQDVAQQTQENDKIMACDEVNEFLRGLSLHKSLVANEISMHRIVASLLDSTCSTEDKVAILTAVLANADKYLESKWHGRIVRPIVRLLSDDDVLTSFIIKCIHEAGGRVLLFETPDELHERIASSKTTEAHKEEIEHFLTANANKFTTRVGVCDVADGFDVWANQFKDFFERKAAIDKFDGAVQGKQEPLVVQLASDTIVQLHRDSFAPSVKAKFAQKIIELTLKNVCQEDLDLLRGAIVPVLFFILGQETYDLIETELKKCTRLLILRKMYNELQGHVAASNLSKEQKANLLVLLRARYEKPDSSADHIKAILGTCLFKEQPMVEFAVREIRACKTQIMEVAKFSQFAQRLEALCVTGENKARLLQALMDNARQL